MHFTEACTYYQLADPLCKRYTVVTLEGYSGCLWGLYFRIYFTG